MLLQRGLLIVLVIVSLCLSGCNHNDASGTKPIEEGTLSPGLNSGFIMYEGKKYKPIESHQEDTFITDGLESTHTVTDSDDETHQGLEIFISRKTGNLFIKYQVGDKNWREYRMAEIKK